MPDPILDYLTAQLPAMLHSLELLVSLDTPSLDPPAVNVAADVIVKNCLALGGTVEKVRCAGPVADCVRAEFFANGNDASPLLVLGHIDTVWGLGEAKRRPFSIAAGNAMGPGVFDMKAGLVQVMFAIQTLRAGDWKVGCPVVLFFNTDEEIGSLYSREVIEREASAAAAVLVAEPAEGPNGALKTARKGVGLYRLDVYGRSAHAGIDPYRGINAIEELAEQIVRLRTLADPQAGTTITVVTAEGGTHPNTVPEHAHAQIDVRAVTSGEAQRLDRQLRALSPHVNGAKVAVSGGFKRPPMERSAKTDALVGLARSIGKRLGFEVTQALSGGGSDGSLTAAIGIPTLDGLGPVGSGAHSDEEYVVVEHIAPRAALLAHLILELSR